MEEINMESIKRTETHSNLYISFIFMALLTFALFKAANGQANYDESKVPDYTLPELFVTQDGEKITDQESWMKKRRPEIVALFEENIYGKIPGKLKIYPGLM